MSAPHGIWDDAQIHAYIDGELDTFTAARLEAACRQDAILHARVERHRRLRSTLKAHFEPVLDEPMPSRLLDAVKAAPAASVTPITARPRRAPAQPLWLGALAASLVVGLLVGWFVPRNSGMPIAADSDGMVATGNLDKALSQALSADGRSNGVAVVLSFQTSDGRYCRSFSLASGADGLACRKGTGWRIEALGQAGQPQPDAAYRQAGSPLSGAVLAAIGEKQAGESLDPEQERQLRDSGWQAARKAPQ